jgi:hypothetical protein
LPSVPLLAARCAESLALAVATTVFPGASVGGGGNEATGPEPASGTNNAGAAAEDPPVEDGELNDANSTPLAAGAPDSFPVFADRIATDFQMSWEEVSDGFDSEGAASELPPLVGLVVAAGADPAAAPPGWL